MGFAQFISQPHHRTVAHASVADQHQTGQSTLQLAAPALGLAKDVFVN